jgi:hypothetical protein
LLQIFGKGSTSSVSKGKLRPAEKKMDQIQLALDKLKTQKELRALLVSLNFYRMFCPQFSFYVQPLFDMLKLEKAYFMFGDDHRKMLDYLMEEIR